MKHSILFIFLLLMIPAVRGQNIISVTPNPAQQIFQADLSTPDLTLEIKTVVKNLTKDTLRLRWQRIEMDKPAVWQTQVCDPNFCYLPNVNTNFNPSLKFEEPVVVLPDSSFKFTLYILPNGIAGTAAVDLDFSLIGDPNNTVIETVMFRPEVSALTTSVPALRLDQVRLYPNPADDYFELTYTQGIDQLIIYNLLGRTVRRYEVAGGRRYSLAGLPDGMYLVSLASRQKGVLKTMRLSKRSVLP